MRAAPLRAPVVWTVLFGNGPVRNDALGYSLTGTGRLGHRQKHKHRRGRRARPRARHSALPFGTPTRQARYPRRCPGTAHHARSALRPTQAATRPLSALLVEARAQAAREGRALLYPSGFVFHESRVGSTLVANMLAAVPTNIVYSESAPPPEYGPFAGDKSGLRTHVKLRHTLKRKPAQSVICLVKAPERTAYTGMPNHTHSSISHAMSTHAGSHLLSA